MKKIKSLVSYDVHVRLRGKNFKPSQLVKNSQLQLSDIANPGEICKIGRFKGLPNEHGSASLFLPDKMMEMGFEEKLEWIVSSLEKNKPQLLNSAIERLTIYLNVGFVHQCSLALDSKMIRRISDLNVDIFFDAYKYEDEEIDFSAIEFIPFLDKVDETFQNNIIDAGEDNSKREYKASNGRSREGNIIESKSKLVKK